MHSRQQYQQEDDASMKIAYNKCALQFLFNKNNIQQESASLDQYIFPDYNNIANQNGLLNSYNNVLSKYTGIYKATNQIEKANIRPHSIIWMSNSSHCLIAYYSQVQNNQSNHFRFDLHLINTLTKNKEKYFPPNQGEVQGIGGLCKMNDGQNILLGSKKGSIYIINYLMQNQKEQWRQNKTVPLCVRESEIVTGLETIQEITTSPDDKKYAMGDEDKAIHIFDVEKKTIENTKIDGHGSRINSLQWHPFKAMVLSASEDKQISIWCPQQKERLLQMYHNMGVNKAIWHQNGNWVLTCGKDSIVKLYDIRRHQKEVEVYKCNSEIKSIAWHPQNPNIFVSGEMDGSFCQWNVNSNVFLDKRYTAASKSPVCDVKYSPLGNILGVLSEDKQLRFFSQGKSDLEEQSKIEEQNQQNQPKFSNQGGNPGGYK